MSNLIFKYADKDQCAAWGRHSQEIQMIDRIMSQDRIYRPYRDFVGWITATSFQLEAPVTTKILLFRAGAYNSFRAAIDNEKQCGIGGWYHWCEKLAESMPRRILQC